MSTVVPVLAVSSACRLAVALAIALAGALPVGCGDDEAPPTAVGDLVYFNGMAYDGASGARITDFDIRLRYFDREQQGSVSPDGRFTLGPLHPFNDYTVEIVSGGYRSFLSHNAFYAEGGHTYFFDAYLFPIDIVAPPATFHVALSDSADRPSGLLRLRPATPSSLYDDADERPAGVDGQLWDNDEDLQFRAVSVSFVDGEVTVEGESLVYGVTYSVAVFGVPGYQPYEGGFQAGVDGEQGLVLQPFAKTPLEVAFRSDAAGPDADGRLVLVFNLPIELDPPGQEAEMTEIVDAALTVAPVDGDGDGVENALVADTPDAIDRGTDLSIEGNQLVLTWDPDAALESTDPDDPVTSVTYGGLDAVRVRPVDSDASEAISLGSLLGGDSVVVTLTP